MDIGGKDNTSSQRKRLHHLNAQLGPEDPVPGKLTRVVGKLMLVISGRP